MGSAETNNNRLQVVARIEDYRGFRGFAIEPPSMFTASDYQKMLAELAAAASSILAVTEMLARLGPPAG